jgi:hypothetical protein
LQFANAQSVYVPLDQDYYHLIDRINVRNKSFNQNIHSSYKPYRAVDILSVLDSSKIASSKTDEYNRNYLEMDNWEALDEDPIQSEKPILKHFFKTPSDMYHVQSKDFTLTVNPILYLGLGVDGNSAERPFINTRGIKVQGAIDNKLGFYSSIEETQAIFPKYVQDYIGRRGVVPNEAFWKKYNEYGVDFFTARGYFTFKATKHISMQFGYDKNFIGDGYRSLFLSDFSAPSTFLKIQTKIWRIQYTNLFTELVADAPYSSFGSNGTAVFPKKFMTAHHLSINITDNFNLGIFEAIMFHRGDSATSAFEWNYLNPIIFYGSIEQFTGSPDNAVIGMDWKWNVTSGVQLYGQALLDEMVVGELKAGNGWWGNKFAVQAGAKYYNVLGVSNLDLQLEYNMSRPFTQSHESIFTNFGHYRMPLAHPLGANFKEVVAIGRYQPFSKLTLSSKLIIATYGTDPVGENYGGDILKDYNTRTKEYDNYIGQGNANKLLSMDLKASYMLKHNLFIDLRHLYRNQSSDDPILSSVTNYTSFALRWNVASREQSF